MNETYEFSFERGQLIKLLGGILSLVVLVFCAGLLVGVALEFRQPGPTLVAQSSLPSRQTIAVPVPPVPSNPPVAIEAPKGTDAAVSDEDQAAIDPDQPAIEEKEETEQKDNRAGVVASDEAAQSGVAGRFAVQLGAFLQPDNAEILSRKLVAKGYDADVVVREDSHGRMWYLVRYGIFQNRSEASAIALQFKSRENLDALVRPSNSM